MQKKQLERPVDMVIATPTRLGQHLKADNVYLGEVQWLVIDEADTMFDQGFGAEVEHLLSALKSKPQPAQVILVSATMTKAVERLVKEHLPAVVKLQTASFHKAVAGCRHEFMTVPPGRDKVDLLIELIQVSYI